MKSEALRPRRVVRYSSEGRAGPHPCVLLEAKPGAVSCLGRIQPDGGVIHIAAPAVRGRPPVLMEAMGAIRSLAR